LIETTPVKYPHVIVQLRGKDGNAFSIMAVVVRALRRAGVPKEEIDTFTKEATSGDYDHLLRTVMKTVEVR
jgi:hypothetical protein